MSERSRVMVPNRHGRACPGHPRLAAPSMLKTWMPGTRPGMTKHQLSSPVQPELLRRRPGAPLVVRHLDVGRSEERERVIDGVREARHATDVRALAHPLGAD